MERMNDLKDLLRHDIQDLYSAEEQIIAALPRMIERASNPALKQALQQHLQITEEQRSRLERVQQMLTEGEQGGGDQGGAEGGARPGLMSRLFRRRSEGGGQMKCLGMQGLLEEGEKVMSEDMNPEVLDAAIIASAQKVEHYEICGYGTARAFARELNLGQVAELLEQTLDEEYEADDRLTDLAIGQINEEAEAGGGARGSSGAGRGASKGGSKGASKGGGSKGASKGASKGTSSGRQAWPIKWDGGGRSKAASKSKSKGASKSSKGGGGSKGASKSGGSKAPSKAAASKGGRNSGGGRSGASKGGSKRGR